jgi:hypothetical protein
MLFLKQVYWFAPWGDWQTEADIINRKDVNILPLTKNHP